jgi:hypothetical protein
LATPDFIPGILVTAAIAAELSCSGRLIDPNAPRNGSMSVTCSNRRGIVKCSDDAVRARGVVECGERLQEQCVAEPAVAGEAG